MPVNIATGTTSLEFYDIELPGRVPLRWTARYGSDIVDRAHSPIGRGWFGLAFCRLRRVGGEYVHTTAHGTQVRFEDRLGVVAGAGVSRNFGAYLELFRDGDRYVVRSWDVETGNIRHLCFDICGDVAGDLSLSAVEDVSGDGIDLIWRPSANGLRLAAMRQRVERRELRFGYDRAGWIERIDLRSPEGAEYRLATYEHDPAGHLVSIADAADFADRFEYDRQGRVTREIVKDGGVFHYRYDGQGRCVLHTGLSHYNERRLRFIPSIRITEVTDSYGNVTTYQHLPTGQLVLEVDPLGGRHTTGYDEHGRIVARTDATGSMTQYGFDEYGNRRYLIDALGHRTTFRYNAFHQSVSMTDAAGQTWRRAYNEQQRLVATMDPLGHRWRFIYDAEGAVCEIVNPKGNCRKRFYRDGVLRSATDWDGNATHVAFDDFGRVIERRGPLGDSTRFRYDPIGNLIQVLLPTGAMLVATYDHAGNLTRFIGADGHATRWRYGPCARLLERTDPLGHTVRYHWGSERGRLEKVINERGELYSFYCDDGGRVTRETSFDGAERRFRYDAEGYVTAYTNGRDETITLQRDALHRVVGQTLPDGSQATFGYDSLGYLQQAVNSDIAVSFERDPLGRVVREAQGEQWVESRYDAAGHLAETWTSFDHRVKYAVDANGLAIKLTTLDDKDLEFERNAYGQETVRRMSGGMRMEQRYDGVGRLIEQRVVSLAAAQDEAGAVDRRDKAQVHRAFGYGRNGAISCIDDKRWGRVDYAYDAVEHLLCIVRERGGSEQFEYDATGSITRMCEKGTIVRDQALTYETGNRLSQKGTIRYEYDLEGRRTKAIDSLGLCNSEWKYQWDAHSRLTRVTRPDGEVWDYKYDALARRVAKIGPSSTVRVLWSGDVIVHEAVDDRLTSTWIFETQSYRPLLSIQDSVAFLVVTDPLGTPQELLDEHGTIAWATPLKAWGSHDESRLSETSGLADCPIRFPGQWHDAETGLSYNYFRYYDAECAGYLSPDPIRLRGGLNLTAYVRNPVGWMDPLGLCGEKLGDLSENEVKQIQAIVDEAGRPLEVVGSAARGERRNPERTDLPFGKGEGTRSDIDYAITPSSMPNFRDVNAETRLPAVDPKHGLPPSIHSPSQGPSIRFAPDETPTFIPGTG